MEHLQSFVKAIEFLTCVTPRTHAVTVEITCTSPSMIRFSFFDATGYASVERHLKKLEPIKGAIAYNKLSHECRVELRDLQRRSAIVNSEWPIGYTEYETTRAYISQLLTDNGYHAQVFIRFNGVPVTVD